jgi:hypothetical protein
MPLFGMTAHADAGKFALMADLARVPKPGGCFLASDWLSAPDQHSEATGAWIADAGLPRELKQLLTAVRRCGCAVPSESSHCTKLGFPVFRMRLIPATTILLTGTLLAVSSAAAPAAPPGQAVPCPPAATALLDGFYRWFLASSDGRSSFGSQEQRFTPELYASLSAGFALRPADGRFVDFDPFSNTQVASYGHRIASCRREGNALLLMRVEVLAGLSPSRASPVPLDYVLSREGETWRIADIRYPGEMSFSLSEYLHDLLQAQPRSAFPATVGGH